MNIFPRLHFGRLPPRPDDPAAAGRRSFDLRVVLALVPILSILPMLLFAVALLHSQWETRQAESHRQLQQLVRTLAVAVDREIHGAIRQLELVSDAPSLNARSMRQFHAYLSRISVRESEWENLVLLDTEGKELLNAVRPFGQSGLHRGELPYRRVLETGLPTLSDIYTSPMTGEPAIAVAVPVRRDGLIDGVLAARLSTRRLSEMLAEPLPPGAISSVIDGTGRIAARSHDFDRFFGHHGTPDYLRLIGTAPRGVGRAKTLEGRAALAVWERLDSGWTVGIGVPAQVLDAPLRHSLLMAAVAGLVLLGLGLAVALRLSRRIAGAIDAAAEDANLLAQARPVTVRHSGIRQIGNLFGAHHRAGQQLARTAADRDEAMQALQAEVRRRDDFLAMLAHELRNPLAPLTNAHRLLERIGPPGAAGAQALAMAQRQTSQLTRLVDDLLDVSRLTSGKTTLRVAPVEMRALVHDAVDAIRPDAQAAALQVLVELPDDPLHVECDAARMRQVLHNLLNNAVKFSRPGGFVRTSLREADGGVLVEVADDGIGIDPQRLDQVFQPFVQIDPGLDRANGGLGLGLALVRQLVEMHGGTVTAHSEGLGTGTRLLVRLPHRR